MSPGPTTSEKVLFYDKAALKAAGFATSNFTFRGYKPIELTLDAQDFWRNLHESKPKVLVLLSHGDGTGPLIVSGTDGISLTLDKLMPYKGSMDLYILSCNTGSGEFAKALIAAEFSFVAPKGYASVAHNGIFVIRSVVSPKDEKDAGWETRGRVLDQKRLFSNNISHNVPYTCLNLP